MKGKRSQFDVIVRDSPTSMEDWKRAQTAAVSQLPPLSREQKEVARKFGLSEERYARSYLSLLYGQERMQNRGNDLGRTLEGILSQVDPGYRLLAVVADTERDRWVATIEAGTEVVEVPIPRELVDDLLDSGLAQYRHQLKALMLSGVGLKRPVKK